MNQPLQPSPNLAVFVDFENLGIRDTAVDRLIAEIGCRGRVLVRRAYGDWTGLAAIKQSLARAAFDLVELPSAARGKNCADIRLAVDAMEVAFTRTYIDTFMIVSGDSDFLPLISRLREMNKRVLVVARRRSVSALLSRSCDEMVLFDPEPCETTGAESPLAALRPVIVEALGRIKAKGVPAGYSNLREEIKSLDPTFTQVAYGHKKFKSLIQEYVSSGTVRLENRGGKTVIVAVADKPLRCPAVPPQESRPLCEALLDQMHWAYRLRIPEGDEEISLSRLVGALRKLYPSVTPSTYGFAKSGGFLKIAQIMEIEGWCAIETGSNPGRYGIRFTRRFFERIVQLEQPPDLLEAEVDTSRSSGDILPFHAVQEVSAEPREGWLPF